MDDRTNASAACWKLRTQVMEFEAEHISVLGRWHQLTIDAYGAQHGGPRVPAIAVPFGLIGLHLALDLGWSGPEVRAAHQFLAQNTPRANPASGRRWPALHAPAEPHWLTIADVAGAETAENHARRVDRWARSVWRAWNAERDRVGAWANSSLPADVRARIRGR